MSAENPAEDEVVEVAAIEGDTNEEVEAEKEAVVEEAGE